MFGSIASVIHYNIFARIVAELACKFLGFPIVFYCGDFGALIPDSMDPEALSSFARFCAPLGIRPEIKKSLVGARIAFLGLEGFAPPPGNSMRLSARLKADKASKCVDSIRLFLEKGRTGHKAMGSLIGKLGFSRTSLFGEFARCQLRALYLKMHHKWYSQTISERGL